MGKSLPYVRYPSAYARRGRPAIEAARQREIDKQRALLLEFAGHLNRTAWEDKTDAQLVDEFLATVGGQQ